MGGISNCDVVESNFRASSIPRMRRQKTIYHNKQANPPPSPLFQQLTIPIEAKSTQHTDFVRGFFQLHEKKLCKKYFLILLCNKLKS
jgi:hypothetical protein